MSRKVNLSDQIVIIWRCSPQSDSSCCHK